MIMEGKELENARFALRKEKMITTSLCTEYCKDQNP